jgi:hypothetical protein
LFPLFWGEEFSPAVLVTAVMAQERKWFYGKSSFLLSFCIGVTELAQGTVHKLMEFTVDMSRDHKEEIIHSWDELFRKRTLSVAGCHVACPYQGKQVEVQQCLQCPWLIVDQPNHSTATMEQTYPQLITCQPPLIGDYSS